MSSSGKNRAATSASEAQPSTSGTSQHPPAPPSSTNAIPDPAPAADGGAAPAPPPETGGAANEQLQHIQELRTLLEQALASTGTGAAPADGAGAQPATDPITAVKRLSSQLAGLASAHGAAAASDKKARTTSTGLGGSSAIPRKPATVPKPPSIFSLDTPVSTATTQGETFPDSGSPLVDNDRIASLAKTHFSPDNAALIQSLLKVISVSAEAVTGINPFIPDEEVQQSGLASLLEPISDQLSTIYTLSESCMANISRNAVLHTLKIDPEHVKLIDMLELNNKLNPHRQPLSLANVRELMNLETLSNKIAAKEGKTEDRDPKGKKPKMGSGGSPYIRFPPRGADGVDPTGMVAGTFPTGMMAGYPPGMVAGFGGMPVGGAAGAAGGGMWMGAGGTAARPPLLPDQCRRCGVRGHFAIACPLRGQSRP